jgi:hypothetical protein
MNNDAIVNNDVSAEHDAADETIEQQPAASREPTERERRLAELARQYNESHGISAEADDADEPEGGQQEYSDDEPQPEVEAVAESDPVERGAAPDPLQELGYYRNAKGELVTKMKINGEEREVKADHVKAYIQKDLAGDYKLQQAAELEKRLQEREALLRQREGQIAQSLSQPPPRMGADEARKQAQAVLEKLWDGDNEAAAEALAELLQRNTATVDPAQILSAAEARALSALEQREAARQQQEWQRSVDEGNRYLSEQHPEIYSDQRLFALVNNETARMVEAQKAGDPEFATLTPKDIIVRAAQEVQGWMDGRTTKPASYGTREARKANLKPMPRGINTVRQSKPEPEVDNSPAAVVARMRASRAVS